MSSVLARLYSLWIFVDAQHLTRRQHARIIVLFRSQQRNMCPMEPLAHYLEATQDLKITAGTSIKQQYMDARKRKQVKQAKKRFVKIKQSMQA